MNYKYLFNIFLSISICAQEVDELDYEVTSESKKLKPKVLVGVSTEIIDVIESTGLTEIIVTTGSTDQTGLTGTTGSTESTGSTGVTNDTGTIEDTNTGNTGSGNVENTEDINYLIFPTNLYYRLGVFVNSNFYMKNTVGTKNSKYRTNSGL